MPVTRQLFWVAPVALSAALLTTPFGAAGPQPPAAPDSIKPRPSVDAEVKYTDDSVMKLKLLDEKLEMTTKYGVLQIAVADVRRIDFATRVSADAAEKVLLAISKLNHADFRTREAATEELKGYRERAYPFVLKALKSDDPEVCRRAEEIATFLRAKVAAAHLEVREFDVVQTDDSRITGRLTAEVLRVGTFQFGDQALRLADVRSLRASGATADENAVAPIAPGNLTAYQQQFGKELTFNVTGFTPTAGANTSLWGTDVYSLDSNLAAAVVHAGLAKPGETVTVRVRVVQSPAQFVATYRNNVSSTAYGAYPAGAFEFVRR
jgi:voltage-gated potassium channel Kch